MALFDFLKRKKEIEKARPTKKEKTTQNKAPKVSAEPKPEKKPEHATAPTRISKRSSVYSFDAVNEPHISEKASYLSEKEQYIFKVSPKYNKNEIKKAVEGLYGVDVLSVNIVKIPPKKRRLGRTEGFRKGYKKAIVKIKQGQKIEIL
jgi:large subunit ribosomal protein L23